MPTTYDLSTLKDQLNWSSETVDHIDGLVDSVYPLIPQIKQIPDQSKYAKLSEAIGEIIKTWDAIESAFTIVWLLFNPQADLFESLADLVKFTDGSLAREVSQGRGHCHRIWDIYWYDLKPWFEENLSEDEQKTLERFFESLGNVDMSVFIPIEAVASSTEEVAEEILNLVSMGEEADARALAGNLLKAVQPLRKRINKSLSQN